MAFDSDFPGQIASRFNSMRVRRAPGDNTRPDTSEPATTGREFLRRLAGKRNPCLAFPPPSGMLSSRSRPCHPD